MASTTATILSPVTKQKRAFVTTNRRQNHSCDRCRHGKRACDAVRSDQGLVACSTCERLGIQCSFKWLQSSQSRAAKARTRQPKRKLSFPSSDETREGVGILPTSPWRGNASEYTKDWLVNGSVFLQPCEERESVWNGPEALDPLREATSFTSSTLTDEIVPSSRLNLRQTLDDRACDSEKSQRPAIGEETLLQNIDDVQRKRNQLGADLPSPPAKFQQSKLEGSNQRNRRSPFRRALLSNGASYSDSFGEICRMTNKRLVSESLLQIYHDSMENALSCWLTEKTCPYEIEGIAEMGSISQESMSTEWGPKFSNRISTRVQSLDRASSSLRNRQLTPSEDRAASRAFDATTMAFAAQWSHLSTISPASPATKAKAGFQTVFENPNITVGDVPPDSRGLFDRSVQEQLWHNARQILQETSGIDSFKVSFAHIIFAFTQRPLDMQKHLQDVKARAVHTRSNSASTMETLHSVSSNTLYTSAPTLAEPHAQSLTSNSDDLDELINLEGPPVFLESALRQLYTWRHRLEGHNSANRAGLSGKDRKTFNLLFWLGVMLETLSAAMNNRPLVVSDEDSAILVPASSEVGPLASRTPEVAAKSCLVPKISTDVASTPWGELFLRPKHRSSQHVIRWPCLYEDAAQALCDAAPVKVLLFRKVTTLQKCAYRRATPVQLEDAIQDALDVYSHWNTTYGRLILDFIASHESLPPRLQSWYVVLTGHWHLAVFLLADLIESIDNQSLSLSSRRQVRQSINLFLQIRKQSAFEIAEIAEVSSPDTNSSFYRTSAFHEHLNQGALLTEPWTDILIRSFGKACCLFLDWLQMCQNQPPEQQQFRPETLYANCANCIKGLRELGRKSDMARLVAMTFAPRLRQLSGSFGPVVTLYHSETDETSPVVI